MDVQRADVRRLSPGATPGSPTRRRASLADAVEALALSGRGSTVPCSVARTIADLEPALRRSNAEHVSEALVFRAPSHQEPPTVIGAGVG